MKVVVRAPSDIFSGIYRRLIQLGLLFPLLEYKEYVSVGVINTGR